MIQQDIVYAVGKIKTAILQSRYVAARTANSELLNLYFAIGRYISLNTRGKDKWGTGAIDEISRRLSLELPGLRGFSAGNMKKMRLFYEAWSKYLSDNKNWPAMTAEVPQLPSSENRATVSNEIRALPTHELLPVVNMEVIIRSSVTHEFAAAFSSIGFTQHYEIIKRTTSLDEHIFYITECAKHFWSVEVLRNHLKNDDYHRIGTMPNNFALTMPDASQASRAVLAFKDELLLDYINIEEETDEEYIDERVLEQEIVRNVKRFIQTLGTDFCFIGNQHRIVESDEEFFIDLLFYHRTLRRLIAIELKRGKFKPIYLGQLNFYLSLLDKYERHADEQPSVGIILCREAKRSIVELAVRDFTKPMGVMTYRLGDDIPQTLHPLLPIMEAADSLLETAAEEDQQTEND